MSKSYKNIFTAAHTNDVAVLRAHLQSGIDVNVRDPKNGMTPWHYAAGGLARDCIEELLRTPGIDTKAEDILGRRASLVALSLGPIGVEVADWIRPYCFDQPEC